VHLTARATFTEDDDMSVPFVRTLSWQGVMNFAYHGKHALDDSDAVARLKQHGALPEGVPLMVIGPHGPWHLMAVERSGMTSMLGVSGEVTVWSDDMGERLWATDQPGKVYL
jgi:hypothetical protein